MSELFGALVEGGFGASAGPYHSVVLILSSLVAHRSINCQGVHQANADGHGEGVENPE